MLPSAFCECQSAVQQSRIGGLVSILVAMATADDSEKQVRVEGGPLPEPKGDRLLGPV